MKLLNSIFLLSQVTQAWAAYKLRVSSQPPLDGRYLTLSNSNRLGIYPSVGLLGAQPYQFTTSTGSEPSTYALFRFPAIIVNDELCLVGKNPYLFIQDVTNPVATSFTIATTAKWGQWTISPPLDQSLNKGEKRTLGYRDGRGARWIAVDKGNSVWDLQRVTDFATPQIGYLTIDIEVVKV